MRRLAYAAVVIGCALVCLTPAVADAQTTVQATSAPAAAPAHSGWFLIGGTATTLRGDCQEDCPSHGKGAYLHTGSLTGSAGIRVNSQMDAGLEVSWVPATTVAGEELRSTFLLGVAQFRPWQGSGFFIRGGAGMAFVRNFVFDEAGDTDPITSKALALTYSAGWGFGRDKRVGLQLFGAQHVAALGDFQTAGVVSENVIGNFWSVGAVLVIR